MMMNFETFKGVVETELINFLPDSMKNGKVVFEKVPKVNRELDAVTVVIEGEKENICPTLYLQDMYERYEQTENLPEVMSEFAAAYLQSMEKREEVRSYEKVSERVQGVCRQGKCH